MNIHLAIIILNWNAAADTLACVEQIAGWQQVKPRTWVVDNASSDGSADQIIRQRPEVQVIRSQTNLGYAGGNNRALVEALEAGYELILLLNNDARIAETDLLQLVDTLHADERLGIVGPLLFDAAQPERLLTAGGQNVVRHLTSHIAKLDSTPQVRLVDYIPGTALLGRAEVFQTVGLLDEAYFFSGELPDLCQRAKTQGYLSAVDTQARAYHEVARSSKFRETLYIYYIIRNRFLFIRKFYHGSKLLFYSFWALYSLALSAKVGLNGQSHTARAIFLGLRDGLRGQFGGQNDRVLAFCEKS